MGACSDNCMVSEKETEVRPLSSIVLEKPVHSPAKNANISSEKTSFTQGTRSGVHNEPTGLYEGSLKDGKPDGEGTYNWNSGKVYRGSWMNGFPHGVGTFRYPDGSEYCGEVFEGQKHGKGTCTWY